MAKEIWLATRQVVQKRVSKLVGMPPMAQTKKRWVDEGPSAPSGLLMLKDVGGQSAAAKEEAATTIIEVTSSRSPAPDVGEPVHRSTEGE